MNMEAWITCGLLLVAFLSACDAFNLDTENVLQKSGERDSLFGFSLAMHWQLSPVGKRMLLVGAPRAKALTGQKSKVTGGLYTCDMSSSSPGCTRVIFDNNENTETESKENQWMGVTVSSQGPGGKIVTCAHRYERRSGESRDIIGRCYSLSQDVRIDPNSREDTHNWHFCDGRLKGHEMFGSCQQGISAAFTDDYHYFIFGAPGAYNWKGEVRLEQNNDTFYELDIYDDGPYETGDERQMKPHLVPVPYSSYLGFSLASGKKLTKKNQLTVVAGAPRANHSGAVVLLKKIELSKRMEKEYILEGEGLASSFGYDVTVLDLNGDDWQDIVVGAPQYFEKDGEIGGAVYVYINNAGNWDKPTRTRLDGPKDSMFGLAVENLGDINQDGYQDFAVGSPYEVNDREAVGSGKVYIYHGSATGVIPQKAAQVLSGKTGVKMFGYSLAGNMDLDWNAYPDLAVGSLSDSVFLYRARPVINIKKEIKFSPQKIDLTKKNCGEYVCLEVSACFTYTANPKSYAPKLTVDYSFDVDADYKKNNLLPRATIPDSSGSVDINEKGKEVCIQRRLTVQDKVQDKLRGIPIDVSVEIKNSKRKRRQSASPQLAPVLDASEPTRAVVQFLKEGCGSDNVCQSNLQMKYRYGYKETDKDAFTPLEMVNDMQVLSLSNQKEIVLEITVTNLKGDDAHEASVKAFFPRSLTYSTSRTVTYMPGNCKANTNGSMADCELGNPFKRGSETTFYIILGTTRLSHNTSEVAVDLMLETTSEQTLTPVKAKLKVTIMLQLSVSGQAQPSQVYFSGAVRGETDIKTESEIGSAITHQFRIINLGKRLTDFGMASLNIYWPRSTNNGKWLLYLTEIGSTGVDPIKCTPEGEINPLKKELVNKRTRRAVENTEEGAVEGTISRLLQNKKAETLSCDSGANCVTIKCPLGGLDSNALITLHSRLWNGTFIEDYSEMHHVEVTVKASLHIDSTNTAPQNADTQVRLTVFPERREARHGGVPWWIIVLSILFGLLLLALLAFLLWKCGVFDKKNKDDSSEKEKLTSNA